jgi:hypothetical protein
LARSRCAHVDAADDRTQLDRRRRRRRRLLRRRRR